MFNKIRVFWEVVNYRASSSIKIFNIDLGRIFPSLFALQIVYEIKRR